MTKVADEVAALGRKAYVIPGGGSNALGALGYVSCAEEILAQTFDLGVRLDHIAEMFRLKGDEIHGDLRPRSESRLAVLPNTTHVTLMERADVIIPMVNDFLDATSQKQ